MKEQFTDTVSSVEPWSWFDRLTMSFFVILFASDALVACSSTEDIFPPLPTSTDTASLELPNPVSIAADPVNGQILVVNSNVDFSFEQGSLAVISVDASDPDAPVLAAQAIVPAPNFGGAIAFDGNAAFVPFREARVEGSSSDQAIRYAVTAGGLSPDITADTGKNPFGIAANAGTVVIASDKSLNVYDEALTSLRDIDLTTAIEAAIDDSKSNRVENVVFDAATGRVYSTNRGGKLLVANPDSGILTHVLSAPANSRGIAADGTHLYVVDGNPPSVWILDPARLAEADSPPQEVDDSELLVAVVSVGSDPNGITVDPAANRAYVANTGDHSVSVIDLNIFAEVARVSLREADTGLGDVKRPFGIAVGTFGGTTFVFTANFDTNNISVIRADTLDVVAVFP